MKLEQYVTDLCAKLRSGEEVKLEALMVMPFRHLIASVLSQQLTGVQTAVVEGLLQETLRLQGVCESLNNQHLYYKEAHQVALKELEAINASNLIEAAPIKAKPVKMVSSRIHGNGDLPGALEQEKLDAAMQGLRKRRAEKKAAQKAKKDE